MFCARPLTEPRTRYCMDFQGQGKAINGECEALGIIDSFTKTVSVIALPSRQATTLALPLCNEIFFRRGAADVLHSDAAPEFMGELLAQIANTKQEAFRAPALRRGLAARRSQARSVLPRRDPSTTQGASLWGDAQTVPIYHPQGGPQGGPRGETLVCPGGQWEDGMGGGQRSPTGGSCRQFSQHGSCQWSDSKGPEEV